MRQGGGGGGGTDGNGGGGGGGGGGGSDYIVYAHSDSTLYSVDLVNKTLNTVGPFGGGGGGSGSGHGGGGAMTDLAVAPNGTIYTISETALFTVSPTTGAATQVGTIGTCGSFGVALTTTPDGKLYMGDFMGNLCQIDISQNPPSVGSPVTMGSGMALTGDMVAVSDGSDGTTTVFGTAYLLTDKSGTGTQANNLLVKVDLTSGAVTTIGSTGYPDLFGVAYQNGQVFGFTHDGTGHVITIDINTGSGSPYGTFTDPTSQQGIAFAGAGVSSLVPITIN
jgi:hypothetical protein